MKQLLFSLFIIVAISSCSQKKITRESDYTAYLSPVFVEKALQKHQEELQFWGRRLQKDTGSFVNMLELGYNYLSLFKLKGNINDLKKGDALIKRASQQLNNTDPDILQALSQVSISQHQFSSAAFYIDDAFKKGGSPYTHYLLSFDAGMELGQYQQAAKDLRQLKDQSSFDFLIRQAKYEDHKGNLKGAITLMQQAFEEVKATNRTSLYCWTLSNLGDMYGHAGRVEEAYQNYLKVLQRDPSYLYALKGIAWIAYAHDKNTTEAKKILHFILSQSRMPDLYLTLAEIAAYEGDTNARQQYIQQFVQAVHHPVYGDMYNKYLIDVWSADQLTAAQSLALAQKELNNRQTPETYSWLAWTCYQTGNVAKAYAIYKTYVAGRTFEPHTLYKGALILSANHQQKAAKELLQQCVRSSFELGPVITQKIEKQLAAL